MQTLCIGIQSSRSQSTVGVETRHSCISDSLGGWGRLQTALLLRHTVGCPEHHTHVSILRSPPFGGFVHGFWLVGWVWSEHERLMPACMFLGEACRHWRWLGIACSVAARAVA